MPTPKYDYLIRTYTPLYFEDEVAWQWIKAQAIAESNLDPDAVSEAGAVGIMQLMPETSKECAGELWVPDTPFDPQVNILMGIHYLHKKWLTFKKEKGQERLFFAFGAYNAGVNNIIKAQRAASRPDIWHDIAAVLPQITGEKAFETIGYVQRIRQIRESMIGVS
jgi:membrane-bound lytic murein transglycosylase F